MIEEKKFEGEGPQKSSPHGGSGATERLEKIRDEYARQFAPTLMDIEVTVNVVVGTAQKKISELLEMQYGDLLVLDQKIGEPVSVEINGSLIAFGELVVSESESPEIAVAITAIADKK